MERGIYFDGWHKHDHCFHPSLPLRNVQMREDLKRYHGTVLVWAGMGGGQRHAGPGGDRHIEGPARQGCPGAPAGRENGRIFRAV